MFRPTPPQITPAAICLLLAVATAAFAADPPSLEPGAWVRATVVDTTGGKEKSRDVTGTVVSLDSTTITIDGTYADSSTEISSSTDSTIEIPRDNITSLETRVQKSKKGKGALIGLGAGVALGVMSGLASGDDSPDQLISWSAGTKAAVGGVFWGLLGALIGSLASPGDKWQEIPENKVQLSFGLAPAGQTGIFLTRRF